MTDVDLAFQLMNKYDSNRYTQVQLAEEYNMPIGVIRQLTQDFGYKHGKRDLIRVMAFGGDFPYLEPYLENSLTV